MKTREIFLGFLILAFTVAGTAQSTAPELEREMAENVSDDNRSPDISTTPAERISPDKTVKHSQFDARLMTAITTVETLVRIAPSEEASSDLEKALEIMKDVQNSTDTTSLGNNTAESDDERGEPPVDQPGERPTPDEPTDEERKRKAEEPKRGPPGFVQSMLGGLF